MSGIGRRDLLRGGLAVGGVALAGGLSLLSCSTARARNRAVGAPPNVLLIMTDDMRHDLLPFMPRTLEAFADGRTFGNCRLNVNLCQPARCGFLTGQWSLRPGNQVYDNFRYIRDPAAHVGSWMQSAGYETAVVGKYPYPGRDPHRLPGWDVQRTFDFETGDQAHGYGVFDGEKLRHPSEFQTDYVAAEVNRFIGEAHEPWFCWMAPTEPHVDLDFQLEARPQDAELWSDLEWPTPPDPLIETKPSWMQALPALDDRDVNSIRAQARGQARELAAVDDAVGSTIAKLHRTGQLADTVVIFTSDNGVMYGEQRIWGGIAASKNVPYDPAMRAPLLARGPGFESGVTAVATCMQDITATCVAIAGGQATLPTDGVDLRDVARRSEGYADRVLLHERSAANNPVPGMPAGKGVSTSTRKLWRHDTDVTTDRYEMYDLDTDPGELVNVAYDPDRLAERDQLEAALDQLLVS